LDLVDLGGGVIVNRQLASRPPRHTDQRAAKFGVRIANSILRMADGILCIAYSI